MKLRTVSRIGVLLAKVAVDEKVLAVPSAKISRRSWPRSCRIQPRVGSTRCSRVRSRVGSDPKGTAHGGDGGILRLDGRASSQKETR